MAEKAVVTGGAGFIGSHVAAALVDAGFDVRVLDIRDPGSRKRRGVTYYRADITSYDEIAGALDGAAYVFHLAALPSVEYSIQNPLETFHANVTGTMHVLEAARAAGVKRVIFASSSSVYGDQDRYPLTEEMPAHPKSPYALHKYMGERACALSSELYGVQTVSLRYANVYGPGFDPSGPYALAFGKFLQLRRLGQPLTVTGTGENTRDYVHVKDVARANIAAATSQSVGKGEAINIGCGEETSVLQLAELIGGPIVHIEPRIEPARVVFDISRARDLLGWEPAIPIRQGIEELKKEILTV